MGHNYKIACFGEVLWDVFPDSQKIGGAPLNVAARLQSFKNEVYMISSVGIDQQGDTIIEFLKNCGVNTDGVQRHKSLATGKVLVSLDTNGSASYDIKFPSAWDEIIVNPSTIEIVKQCDVFVFGSLITRNEKSKNTLFSLLDHANFKVFDMNLRPPFYNLKQLELLMQMADFIKLNEEELVIICTYFEIESEKIEDQIKLLSGITQTAQICVSKGSHGAILFMNGNMYRHDGFQVKVADTVGAGDSFLATLLQYLKIQNTPEIALKMACAMGALVASKKGATPIISNLELKKLVD